MLRVRPATSDDLVAFCGRSLDEEWFAMVAVDDADRPVAVGLITWDEWGRAWGWFDSKRRLSPFIMHRTATTVIGWLANTGQPDLRVFCENFEAARHWLRRLGFAPDADGTWMKCLASKS